MTIATSDVNLYPPGFWFADVMSFFSGVTFVLFRFRLYSFSEAAALSSIVLRYAGAPIATRATNTDFSECLDAFTFFFEDLKSNTYRGRV